MKIKTMDARRLGHSMLTELRKRGVTSVQDGQSPEIVASAMGISRGTMYGWLALYRCGGWSALDARKRGGRKPKLDGTDVPPFQNAIQCNIVQLCVFCLTCSH